MDKEDKFLLKLLVLNLASVCLWIVISYISFRIGQLHPKYTPEEQIVIREGLELVGGIEK